MKFLILVINLFFVSTSCYAWGFWAHRTINRNAVFLLPPEMLVFFKPQIDFLAEHAVDPDKRRYVITEEGSRHFIDLDMYGSYPYTALPRNWEDAIIKYSRDSVVKAGIAPWHVQIMLRRLTQAFKEKNFAGILKNSAEIGHYIADACVPLHASSNYNGQLTNQLGIHALWESRIPELLAETSFDLLIGKAEYLDKPNDYIWTIVLESGRLSETVLAVEKQLSSEVPDDSRFSFEERNNIILRQYSTFYTTMYNNRLNRMVEERMRTAIYSIACFWYTAWVDAGQPDLRILSGKTFSPSELKDFDVLNAGWQKAATMMGRTED